MCKTPEQRVFNNGVAAHICKIKKAGWESVTAHTIRIAVKYVEM
jgi:hypothetical protein